MKIKNKITKKNLLVLFFLAVLLSFFITNGEESEKASNCSYSGKINQCMESQDNIRSISSFVCINGSLEDVALQVVLDEKFKEIDEKIEEYLEGLENAKDNYFGPNRKEEFTNGTNDIEKYLGPGGKFEKEYKDLCDGKILAETAKCLGNEIPNINASNFLNNFKSGNMCRTLYEVTLNNYRATAYAILKENKFQIQHDEHKKFTQKQRGKFDELIDSMIENRGYLNGISDSVQTTTKYPH